MKPIKTIEEFQKILNNAKKEHEKRKLVHVYLPIVEKELGEV